MRDLISTVLELVGLAALTAAGALVALPLGLAIGGLSLFIIGLALGGPR